MRVSGFYSIVGLTTMPWLRRCFLLGEILFNLCILWSSFLIGLSWLGLNVVRKIFPGMFMRVGQVRPHQTCQRFYYSLHRPSCRLLTFVYTFQSSPLGWLPKRWHRQLPGRAVNLILLLLGLKVMWMRLTSSLGSSALPDGRVIHQFFNFPYQTAVNFWQKQKGLAEIETPI